MKTTPSRAFDFSRFLGPEDESALGDPQQWDWVEPFSPPQGRPLEVPPDLVRRHKKWLRTRLNTHAPAHREIMLTMRGQAVYSIEGQIYYRRPGTVILLERHQNRDLRGGPHKVDFTCLWIHLFSSNYLTYYINGCNENGRYTHLLPMRSRSGDLPRLLMEAWDQCQKCPEDRLARGLLHSLITGALLEILGQGGRETPGDHHKQVVQSVKEYIREHLAEDLSLGTLANLAGYSPFFFHRLFLRHTGQTPVQYVNAARLERAAQLLDANYTVAATAAAVGFSSVSYFHQFFRKHFRRTPREWVNRFSRPWQA